MGALLSALWNGRDVIQYRALFPYLCGTLVVFASALWCFGIISNPLHLFAQHFLPCEIYTRSKLGDIAVYETIPPQAYVENDRLNDAIEKAVLQREPQGITILYSPPHSGKTSAITRVLHKLHVLGKVNVLQLQTGFVFGDFLKIHGVKHLNFLRWVEQAMGCTKSFSSHQIADIFSYDRTPPRSVLFIDQFETVTTEAKLLSIKNMMHKVAIDVSNHKNYITLVATSDLYVYKEMLTWNSGEKFQEVVEGGFLWTQDELQMVVDAYQRKGFFSPTTTPASMSALQEVMKNMTSISKLLRYLENNRLVDFVIPAPVSVSVQTLEL